MQRKIAIVLESALDNTWYDMERLLMQAGIDPSQHCVFPLVPRVADLTKLKWTSDEVQQGIQRLERELAEWQPHFVLLLDRSGYLLRAFHGEHMSCDTWRGSVLLAKHVAPGVKTMATFSPRRLAMEYNLTGIIRFDLKRCLDESRTDTLEVPVDDIEVSLTKDELLAKLHRLQATKPTVAFDLEGYPMNITCMGFADGPNHAFVVPFVREDGTSYWDEADELELWEACAAVLEDPAIAKICHNGMYELFCLAWGPGIVMRGFKHDTMVMWFELYAEMEKNLGFIVSLLTKHPHYKSERKSTDDLTKLRYNGKDCCRTYEIWQRMLPMLKPRQLEHYSFNMELLVPLAYMSLRGIRYDSAEAKRRLEATQEQIYELQDEVNQEAAKSEERPALRAFYQALAEPGGSPAAGDAGSASGGNVCKALIPLLTEAFCCCERDRAEWREVEEVWWQPHQWSTKSKRWVKKGKQTKEPPTEACGDILPADFPANPEECQTFYLAKRKLVQKRCPVAIKTIEDVRRFTLASRKSDCSRVCKILSNGSGGNNENNGLTPAQRGELATLLGVSLKISASGRDKDEEQDDGTTERGDERDANWYLYEHCKLPKQWIKEGIRNTDRLASDAKAVVLAWMASGKTEETRDPRALVFAKLKRLLTETKALRVAVDQDDRIRASLNLVGTDTHRISCSKSPTGTSRLNLQTVTKKHRSMYLADEGCEMGQLDLAGADGWTTASYAKMLGDPTMLEDLKARLKPAQIVVLMLDKGEAINSIPRDQLKVMCKDITEEKEWRYFPMKKVVHGSSYQSGKRKVSEGIALDSFKATGRPVYFSPDQCERVQQRCFFVRYPGIKRYQEWVAREILEKGQLVASNGFARKFFGRKTDSGTVRKGLAHLPQVYTTYATELAMYRLWNDPENRAEDGSLHIELLLTVHDSLLTQWPKERTEWAKAKQHDYFNNPIQIAHETVVIPASGSYGPSWGEQVNSL